MVNYEEYHNKLLIAITGNNTFSEQNVDYKFCDAAELFGNYLFVLTFN